NPQAYLPDVAGTAMNLSILSLQSLSDRERSLDHAREALVAALPFAEVLPAAEKYARTALKVVEAWGLDAQTFLEETIQSAQDKAD
ncbi:MAG: hypothetical protein OEW25_09085, partial [Nitrospira sp.]|nr:hypothetical protein [Nitrospira sp.]